MVVIVFSNKKFISNWRCRCNNLQKKRDYNKLLRIRQYGWNKNRISNSIGINSRCDELQAAILNVKIPKIDNYIKRRNFIAKKYNKILKDLPLILPKTNPLVHHSFHLYVIRVKKSLRDHLINYMKKHKIYLGIHYKTPCHLMPNFKKKNIKLKFTEKNMQRNSIFTYLPGT